MGVSEVCGTTVTPPGKVLNSIKSTVNKTYRQYMTIRLLFEDVRGKWQVTVFISEVSNYTGLQITVFAVYIFRVSSQLIINKSYHKSFCLQ